MKVLVLNGPNLNLLGKREPDIYGRQTLDDIMQELSSAARELDVEIESFQSNNEGALVDKIHQGMGECDGIIINPAGYTHTSVSLRDAILACGLPCVEVHLSNPYGREEFRRTSLTVGGCIGQVCGFGGTGYRLALHGLVEKLK